MPERGMLRAFPYVPDALARRRAAAAGCERSLLTTERCFENPRPVAKRNCSKMYVFSWFPTGCVSRRACKFVFKTLPAGVTRYITDLSSESLRSRDDTASD